MESKAKLIDELKNEIYLNDTNDDSRLTLDYEGHFVHYINMDEVYLTSKWLKLFMKN
jgi:hypothetical protein